MATGIEEELVPRVLHEHGVRSVLVPGAGSGRQYGYLGGFSVRGFDLSPTLAAAARERYPNVETAVSDLVDAELVHPPADAVVTTALLQHIPPDRIEAAVASLCALAEKLVVIRETTWLARRSSYQFAHDYDSLFRGWKLLESVVTDENAICRVELRVHRR
jgi:trans-aconitate methyltransferase